jgi:hypothetical protein
MLNVTHGSPARRRRRLALLIGTATLALAGCSGPGALRSHYAEYSQAQAQAGNQQTLLNLARIRNGHPPYFLQLGPFTASYSFTVGSTGSFTHLWNPLPGVSSGSSGALGLSGSATEAPLFNFSPLSGPAFAAVLMTPIAANSLSSLLLQGFSATVLLRMFADEITLTTAAGQKVFLINGLNSEDADNYGDLLRLAEVLQALQSSRSLHIETVTASGITTLRVTTNERSTPVLQRLAAREGARVQLKSLANQTLTSGFSADIKLRSYVGALYAMAGDGAIADSLPVALRDSLPENQRDAILRIDAAADLTEPQAASVDYAGRKYVISDRAGSMRYRTSFQALRFVFAECELNPAQVPQSTTLQVR